MLLADEDVIHPGIMDTRFHRGFKLEDRQAGYSKVTGRRSFLKSWAKRAAVLERFFGSAKSRNRLGTARSFYH
jgi:hypothetical protein